MAAYSVSGVGQGSALKAGQKGAEDMYLGVEKLIGTKVVYANSVTLSSGTAAVLFPEVLPGVAGDYMVLAGGSAAYAYASSLTTAGFTMNGTGSQVVNFAVVRMTAATVTHDTISNG